MKKHILIVLSPLFIATFILSLISCTEDADAKKPMKLTNLKMLARLTGEPLPNEIIPAPNNTIQYDVYGTDLGIMWHMEGNKIGIFFGDTNGEGFRVLTNGGGNGGNWRSNFVAFSEDTDLEDGLTISSMALDEEGKAREICAGAKTGGSDKYNTSIPTGAIRADGVDYVHYMNIYEWAGGAGRWLTNFSSLYASKDGGQTWERKKEVEFHSDSHFSQVAYAKKDGYVYMIGTQSGRGDAAYLARFKEKDILDMTKYEYWNGENNKWVKGDEAAATPVIEAPVGETSLMYLEKQRRWIITYLLDHAFDKKAPRKAHTLVYRESKDLKEWSDVKVIATDKEYPKLYCAYMHPLKNNGDKLYFLMSMWHPYNVFLLSADIELEDIGV
ncbi:DUF4185 domain-containing protein [Prevotella sp. 10(H)]|uniref:DUF4185 domain-containing protein n=1 Tax=Prevotella sp. 10(H) TaxID=1158294 RepID=UPI000692218C|nr:DUF4185 domain-containing protein [Prevotella sp. 10(H)]